VLEELDEDELEEDVDAVNITLQLVISEVPTLTQTLTNPVVVSVILNRVPLG
jgi:hypothetical protein